MGKQFKGGSYDFFVGIGDINSSFLPKKNGQLTGPTKRNL